MTHMSFDEIRTACEDRIAIWGGILIPRRQA
jgi:hypothetical protein